MGADVVGIDNSLSMVAAAKAKGLDARLMDAAQLKFGEAFDAAFSNATLHWVLDKERAARAIWFALKNGGRFAGEMGGQGNLATLRQALDDMIHGRRDMVLVRAAAEEEGHVARDHILPGHRG